MTGKEGASAFLSNIEKALADEKAGLADRAPSAEKVLDTCGPEKGSRSRMAARV